MSKRAYIRSVFPILVFCALAASRTSAQTASDKPNLFGTIVDPVSIPIDYANIWIHESHDQKSYSIRVGPHGTFATHLPDGTYDVMIATPGLAPFSKYIQVHGGQGFNLKVRLRIDTDYPAQY